MSIILKSGGKPKEDPELLQLTSQLKGDITEMKQQIAELKQSKYDLMATFGVFATIVGFLVAQTSILASRDFSFRRIMISESFLISAILFLLLSLAYLFGGNQIIFRNKVFWIACGFFALSGIFSLNLDHLIPKL